jgi:aspartate/methionine/tyrosine aminotransferase
MLSFFWKKFFVRTGIARFLPSVKKLLGGGERFLHYFSDRALAAPVEELIDPSWLADAQAPDTINLALGSPRCELPLGALRGVHDARGLSAWGLPELRGEIGDRQRLPIDEILITHGATGAFAAVIDSFVNPGARVVLFDPTSPIFILGLKHRRARIRWVRTWLEDGKTRFDIELFARAMRGARMVVLSDPANPTGGVLAPEDLEQIAFWAKRHDVLIYVDESFSAFRHETTPTNLTALPNADGRLLIAGSVSKSHGLSAARVGWLTGNRHLLRAVAVTMSMAAPFVAPMSQHAALTALQSGDGAQSALRDEFAGRRRYLAEALVATGLKPALPAAGFFFWLRVDHLGLTGREFARRLMTSQRVLVNSGEPFGPSGVNHVRISFATEEGRLREGMQRLAELMAELRREASVPAKNDLGNNAELEDVTGIRPELEKTHQPL